MGWSWSAGPAASKAGNFFAESPAKPRQAVAAGLFIILGIALRAWNLDAPQLWVDEAESCINALTILDRGYPASDYLGLPIYENTLSRPWPESEEYAFKDDSYSDRGVAVYHGWLPLYAIAASFKLARIAPDRPAPRPAVVHPPGQIAKRTWVPRLPSIFFSAVFLFFLYRLAREMYGSDAALAAIAIGALENGLIYFGRQARYYSATLALSAMAGLAVWKLGKSGRWRDFIFAGVAFTLLFHTHILSFFILSLLLIAWSPRILKMEQWIAKSLVFAFIVIVGCVPWLVGTGFFAMAQSVHKAWPLLNFQTDFLGNPIFRGVIFAMLYPGILWIFGQSELRKKLPSRLANPALDSVAGYAFAGLWAIIAFFSFTFLTPPASFWEERMLLVLAMPALLYGAMFAAAISRAVSLKYSTALSVSLALMVMLAAGMISFKTLRPQTTWIDYKDMIVHMQSWRLSPETRIYATPNHQLPLTYYSGMPVQSVAPVRKSFLDDPKRDVIVLRFNQWYYDLPIEDIQAEARKLGRETPKDEARKWQRRIAARYLRDKLQDQVAEARPPRGDLGPLGRRLLARYREYNSDNMKKIIPEQVIIRGFDLDDWDDWWPVFFYRFADVQAHWKKNLNYADRIRGSTATVYPTRWIVYDCTSDRSASQF